MLRNCKRKQERTDESTMKLAIELVVKDGFTLRKSSERTGVLFQTLQRYVKMLEITLDIENSSQYIRRELLIHSWKAKCQNN